MRTSAEPSQRPSSGGGALGDSLRGDRLVHSSTCFPDRLELIADRVHVVRFRLDETVDGATGLLDQGERDRANRFVFERDRRRFLISHAWMRIVLGRCLARPPESLRFAVGLHGKPALIETATDLRFNLSHAGERALLALTLGREVGIDIEEERPVEVFELARRFFASSESEALRNVPASERIAAFFRCWTRKEAFIKALGEGLAFPLDCFEVSVLDDPSPQLLRACTAWPDMMPRWRIVSLASEPGYAAAMAAAAGDWRVVQWEAPARAL